MGILARVSAVFGVLALMTGFASAQPLQGPAPDQWGGFYIGLFGGLQLEPAPLAIDEPAAGIQAGYDFVFGQTLVGVSVKYATFGFETIRDHVGLGARVGVLAGDRAILYVEPSIISFIPSASIVFWSLGGGAEYAIGRNISIFGEVAAFSFFGASSLKFLVDVGLNLHLGH